jgi:hypothetical protein
LDFPPPDPIRDFARRVELVETLVAAPLATQEQDWIEWKSHVDLSSADGKFVIAKQILGFANRDPVTSRLKAGGCAFLVVGAVPGDCPGAPVHDVADVVRWLRPFLGAEGPVWDVTYIPIRGRQVQLFTIEAPAQGDPIRTLRRQYGSFHEGSVFVRSAGFTEPATSAQLRMLVQRATQIHGSLDLETQIFWDKPVGWWSNAGAEQFRAEGLRHVEAWAAEYPTSQEFRSDLNAYLGKCGEMAEELMTWAMVSGGKSGSLTPLLHNRSSAVAESVVLTLELPPTWRVFADEDHAVVHSAPQPPDPPGTMAWLTRTISPSALRFSLSPDTRAAWPTTLPREDRTFVRYPEVTLHADELRALSSLSVVADESVTSVESIAWRATSRSTMGVLRGRSLVAKEDTAADGRWLWTEFLRASG